MFVEQPAVTLRAAANMSLPVPKKPRNRLSINSTLSAAKPVGLELHGQPDAHHMGWVACNCCNQSTPVHTAINMQTASLMLSVVACSQGGA